MTNALKIAGAAIAFAFFAPAPGFAADEYNVSTGVVTAAGAPLGLRGVDAVTLSTVNEVTKGDATHTVVEDGVVYYFASADSARLFKAAPEKYAPQYGGFCAYAVAKGKKFDGDPHYADIVDGKLYLFVNAAVFELYKKDSKRILAKSEKTWPLIQHKAVGDL